MKRILVVFELPPSVDWQLAGLAKALAAEGDHVRVFHGLARSYQAGGWRPVRLGNLVWMYALLPWVLLVWRPDWLVVRTSPPGIQLWAALWGACLRMPVAAWMMDYHPEIEARACERHPCGRGLARVLRACDQRLLRRCRVLVAPDQAMGHLLALRAGANKVRVHPTWGAPQATPSGAASVSQELSLVYAGHLGTQHGLATLTSVLGSLRRAGAVTLHVVPSGEATAQAFEQLGQQVSVKVIRHERLPDYASLVEHVRALGVWYGIVLMRKEAAGLVSPSKFSACLDAGVPLLYVGPEGSNADRVCVEFGGGCALREGMSEVALESSARRLLLPEERETLRAGVQRAREYFAQFGPDSLATLLREAMSEGEGR